MIYVIFDFDGVLFGGSNGITDSFLWIVSNYKLPNVQKKDMNDFLRITPFEKLKIKFIETTYGFGFSEGNKTDFPLATSPKGIKECIRK
jgi:phosphoglycolate phosphatase-like HAD superfamily hydrolase